MAPLRIAPIFVNFGNLNASYVALVQTLVNGAVAKWSAALQTYPVVGPLYATRACISWWNTGTGAVWPCKTLETSPSCDLGDGNGAIVFNSTYLGAQTYYPNNVNTPAATTAGAGIPNADFAIFVTALDSNACGSGNGGSVIAYAATCQRDTYDRPTIGRTNFCPGALHLSPSQLASQIMVAMHEIGHSLGFTSDSWPLMRFNDSARSPRTPRDVNKPNLPSSSYRTADRCNTPGVYFAAQTTVAYFDERGISCSYPTGIASSPSCVHKFVTPMATAAAQWFFNCSTLNGAELEDQFLGACDIQSSHWDQRIFAGELMAPVIVGVPKVSPVTLALMQDTGWYAANFSNSDSYRIGRDFGFYQGCAFAMDKCLDASSVTSGVGTGRPPHYYYATADSASGTAVCTPARDGIAYMSLSTYTSPLETYFQYYPTATTGGSNSEYYDYCPLPTVYSNRKCTLPSNQFSSDFRYGMQFGASSLCALSSLRATNLAMGQGAGCYAMACNSTEMLTVFVASPTGSGAAAQVVCTAANAYAGVSVPGLNGQITCPDPASICGTPLVYGGPPPNATAANNIPVTPSPLPSISGSARAASPRPSGATPTAPATVSVILALVAVAAMMTATAASA